MAFRPFIIDTSDCRCKCLFDSLKQKGFKVREYAGCEIDTFEVCILIFPPAKHISEKDICSLKKGSAVFGGNASIEAKKQMSVKGISYFNIMQDEKFTVKNTIPTALGCIAAVMDESQICINEMKILILGYGRVAKTLSKYLTGLDCKAYIYTVDVKEKALAEVLAVGTENSLENIDKYDLIINTVPARLIDRHICDLICEDSLVYDLASGNHVDLEYLRGRGIRAIKASSLPGKVAPKSAGGYMEECILDTLNRNSGLKAVFLVH